MTQKAQKPSKSSPNPFGAQLASLIKRLGITQEAFADASGKRLRRTEISRAVNGGAGATTVRWARGIATAAGVSLIDACAFIEGEITVEELLARREGLTTVAPAQYPPELGSALASFFKARRRGVRPSTLGAISALLKELPPIDPPMSQEEWLLLVGELEGVYERLIVGRSHTPTEKVPAKT